MVPTVKPAWRPSRPRLAMCSGNEVGWAVPTKNRRASFLPATFVRLIGGLSPPTPCPARTAMTTSLEKRVADLETQLTTLKNRLDAIDQSKPWWERIAGSFRDDPIYEKAMRLGREYREGQ